MQSAWTYLSIYLLTAFDVLLTHKGLQKGTIIEVNPLMSFFFSRSQVFTVAGMLAGSAIILLFIYRVRERIKWLPIALTIVLGTKMLVTALHLYVIIKLLKFGLV